MRRWVGSIPGLGFVDPCSTAPCCTGLVDASQRVGWGYQLGAGLEYAQAESWTVKAEYAYMDFGSTTISGTAGGVGLKATPSGLTLTWCCTHSKWV